MDISVKDIQEQIEAQLRRAIELAHHLRTANDADNYSETYFSQLDGALYNVLSMVADC